MIVNAASWAFALFARRKRRYQFNPNA